MHKNGVPWARSGIRLISKIFRARPTPLDLRQFRGSNGPRPFGHYLNIRTLQTPSVPSDSPRQLYFERSTIYAVSTAPGRAGIAIIRISGRQCLDIYRALCPSKAIPRPRYASLRMLYNPKSKSYTDVLDSGALVLYFPAPKTVTGEEVLELHVHGGTATVKAVLAAIPQCVPGAAIRYAEPGEFTRLAFQNNRLDLAQVEALSDTLSAETEQQRRAAVRGNSGALGRTYEEWRQQLLGARGELEAIIDFSEDQYFDTSNTELLGNIRRQIDAMLKSVRAHEEASRRGELLRKGVRISMLGHPNAGKSSLLNIIVGREASIVSTEAGTTRDVVEVSLDIEGYLCTFADTAGLRSAILKNEKPQIREPPKVISKVEQEGIRRAKAKARESDVILVLASVEPHHAGQGWEIRCDFEALQIASLAEKSLIIVNKVDHVPPRHLDRLVQDFRFLLSKHGLRSHFNNIIMVSCIDGRYNDNVSQDPGNIKLLVDHLVSTFKDLTVLENQDLWGVTERQRQLLQACRESCDEYIRETEKSSVEIASTDDFDIVVAAEHLRSAASCLSRITGRGETGDVEEVLGVVFEKFCVGK